MTPSATTTKPPKAYSYLRFSTPEQAAGDSYRRQTQSAIRYAAENGLELVEASYEDLGVSAYRQTNAETGMLAEFMEAVRKDIVPRGSWLLIESMDRLSRAKPRKAVRLLEDICEAGITVVTLNDRRVYDDETLDDDPTAFLVAFLVAVRANEESEMKSKRLKAAWHEKRNKAGETKLTSKAPAWLTLDEDRRSFSIIKEKAAIVRRIFDMAAAGAGQHTITETLNRERIPPLGRGAQWHRSYVAKLLKTDTVVGTYEPHTVEYDSNRKRRRMPVGRVEGYYPPIVDREVWATVKALSQTRSSSRGRHAAAGVVSNILGGVARCSRCGGSMTLVTKNKRDRYLVCTKAKTGAGCSYQSARYSLIEAAMIDHADGWTVAQLQEGSDHPLAAALGSVRNNIDATRSRLEEIITGANGPTSATLRITVATLNASLVELEAREGELAEAVDTSMPALVDKRIEELREALKSEGLDRSLANRLIRQLMESAEIGLDSGLITFHWRHGAETDLQYAWSNI